MVSLVLVSHSRALAEAAIALARQMAPREVSIVAAAGAGEDGAELGTDPLRIADAIRGALDPDGAVVLMDLGSAVLSAETALDLLPDDARARVRLCPAPLVEGAVVAAIQAGLGADLDSVYREARQALEAKVLHLGGVSGALAGAAESPASLAAPEAAPEMVEQAEATAVVRNAHGLHARPAARFVQAAADFPAEVSVRKQGAGGLPVSGRSLNRLATLGAGRGDVLVIAARGPRAAQAVEALRRLVEQGFGEPDSAGGARVDGGVAVESAGGMLRAIPVSEGIAIGPLRHYRVALPALPDERASDAEAEARRLDAALRACLKAIEERRRRAAAQFGAPQAAIFEAHALILQDDALLDRARHLLREQGWTAPKAWHLAVREMAGAYQSLADEYMRQRVVDLLDVGDQVLAELLGGVAPRESDRGAPAVLLAQELTPSQVAELDPGRALGLITLGGGATSHAAILTRALGIPAVAGADAGIEAVADGVLVAVDGFSGAVWVEPPASAIKQLADRRAAWLEQQRSLRADSRGLTYTRDGRRVEVAANLGGVADARAAVVNGAEAVGVLRTEFLYLTRQAAPTEEEQLAALRQIAATLAPRPVIARTLDVGGDKVIPYLPMPEEANPYLGVRAVRLSLQHRDLFRAQARAILRAAAEHDVRMLIPMVSLVEEIEAVREVLRQAHDELQSAGLAHRWPIGLGVMVETPAAALMADALAARVDFLSVGTNDLTQYTLAAERGNPDLAAYADALHPAVLMLIQRVADAARRHGKWSGVCGEIASDPVAAPVLIGLGVDELSMNPAAIPSVKAAIRGMEYGAAQELAGAALRAESAGEARRLARHFAAQAEQAVRGDGTISSREAQRAGPLPAA
jgi:phosphocarrier protein FPr